MVRKIPFMRVYALTKFALGQISRQVMIGLTQPGIKYNPMNFYFFEGPFPAIFEYFLLYPL